MFPNHQAIATGLYAESSGIVSYTMHDPSTGQWFHVSSRDPAWWLCEPVRTTLRKFNRTTRTVFWPGSDVKGRAADVFWAYNGSVPYVDRVARVVSLLEGTAQDLLPLGRKADFVPMYLEGVDHACHQHGPGSPEVSNGIAHADASISELLKLAPGINLIVVSDKGMSPISDHGMSPISDEKVVDLNAGVLPGSALSIAVSPLLMLAKLTSTAGQLYIVLDRNLRSLPNAHVTVFRKQDLLERWHLKGSDHVSEVLVLADLGWTLSLTNDVTDSSLGCVSGRHDFPAPNLLIHGDRGWDNTEDAMQGLFVAAGPVFSNFPGRKIKYVSAVDVYLLLCNMFGATSAPNNNGSITVVRDILNLN
jgi:hypothetical protein